jgi:hypothetical protein
MDEVAVVDSFPEDALTPPLLRERDQGAPVDMDQPSGSREVYRAHDASAFEVSFFL